MQSRFTQEADFRQERDFGAKISATFEFLAAHWRPLSTALLYIVLPVALVSAIALGAAQNSLFSNIFSAQRGASTFGSHASLAYRTGYTAGSLVGISGLVLTYVLLASTIYGYVLLRIQHPAQQDVTPAMVWQRVRGTAPWLLVSVLGMGLVLSLAFLLLIIPGIYLMVPLSLLLVVTVMENISFDKALRRCLALVSGQWWATLGLLAMMIIIKGFLGFLFQIPLYIALAFKAMHWPILSSDAFMLVTQCIGTIGQLLLYIPSLVAVMFQYFNLVEQKEGLGLRAMVESIGQQPVMAVDHHYRPDEEGEY